MPGQSVRRSQYITTYGPGAILEAPDGPRIIPIISQSGVFDTNSPATFEITERKLSAALLNGAHILRVPSNAELDIPEERYVYKTRRFPKWSLCVRHNVLYFKASSDLRSCPSCTPHANSWTAWSQASRQAIRFVSACPQGHLDDVPWNIVVQHKSQHPFPPYYRWQGAGGALKSVTILCPTCGGVGNLGTAYSKQWTCSGKFPEISEESTECHAGASIVQRGAANLFMPELKSAVTIPPADTKLHRLFERREILSLIMSGAVNDKAVLVKLLSALVDSKMAGVDSLQLVESCPEDEVARAIADIKADIIPTNAEELKSGEFTKLRRAAEYGAPFTAASTPNSPPQFEVVLSEIKHYRISPVYTLRVTPINRLRVVMVQLGYRRLGPVSPVVYRAQSLSNDDWYPGVELFGEGVFVDLVDHNGSAMTARAIAGDVASRWLDVWRARPHNPLVVASDDGIKQYHPEFVWWHTLTHRLITAIAVDSGYSAMAIRERIYCSVNDDGTAAGGALLYTAQPGGDGTLGGLVSLVPHFAAILERAFHNLDCSNDPLCSDIQMTTGRVNGAACYACTLVSETSCEHRNVSLDRLILRED